MVRGKVKAKAKLVREVSSPSSTVVDKLIYSTSGQKRPAYRSIA